MRVIGYCQVSTEHQSLDSQVDALRHAGCARIYRDKLSGTSRKRPGLNAALKGLKPGDLFIVVRLDRLGRSLIDLIEIMAAIERTGAAFRSLHDAIDTTSAVGQFTFHIIAAMAQFERQLIAERTRAGLAAARARGAEIGRRRKLTERGISEARRQLASGMKIDAVAGHHGISRSTLYRHLRRGG